VKHHKEDLKATRSRQRIVVRVHSEIATSGIPKQLLGFAEEFRMPGQPVIQPERFAEALHLRVQDLAKLAGVHRTTVTETPSNARLQRFLREALRALSAAFEVTHDRDRSIFWFRNSPIPEFGHRTAETLVAEGKTDAVVAYLTSISAGSSG
jgi:transcriptional regulator with XRE-family HTH domain